MDEKMRLADVLAEGYVQQMAFQEAENNLMAENVAKHFSLYGCHEGEAQVLKYNGFMEDKSGNMLIAPTDLVEMWNEETKESWMQDLLAIGVSELEKSRRLLVACLVFGRDKVSDDGIHFLDPWEGHQIGIDDVLSLLGLANNCFWHYVKKLSHNDPENFSELDPQPLALAYHWGTSDENGIKEWPHIHLLFSVEKVLRRGTSE